MNIRQIPGELGRYWVQSRSRPNITHIVEFSCSCESFQAHRQNRGKTCAHMLEVLKQAVKELDETTSKPISNE